jgi:hypothetical protein
MFIRLQGEGRWSPAQGLTCHQDCSYPLAQQGSGFFRFYKLSFFTCEVRYLYAHAQQTS